MRTDFNERHKIPRRIEAINPMLRDPVMRDEVDLSIIQTLRRKLIDLRLSIASHKRIEVEVKRTSRKAINPKMVLPIRRRSIACHKLREPISIEINQSEKADPRQIHRATGIEAEASLRRRLAAGCPICRLQLLDHTLIGHIGRRHIVLRIIEQRLLQRLRCTRFLLGRDLHPRGFHLGAFNRLPHGSLPHLPSEANADDRQDRHEKRRGDALFSFSFRVLLHASPLSYRPNSLARTSGYCPPMFALRAQIIDLRDIAPAFALCKRLHCRLGASWGPRSCRSTP